MRHTLPLLLLLLFGGLSSAHAANWSYWRGPEQNGVSRERDLPEKFSLDPKAKNNNLVWKAPYGSITTPIVQDGRVYIINRAGEKATTQERVMAFDARSGKKLWEHKFNVFQTDIVDDRVGWTHMVGDPETGNVYSHGTQGFLICFNRDGKILWRRSMTEEFGRVSGYGGRVTSPVVDGKLLILGVVNSSWGEQTVGASRFVAFDKLTGEIVWWGSAGFQVRDTYYSTPIVANIGGQRLVISGGGDGGVHAFKVNTGEKVWSLIFGTGAVNCSAVVDGNRVFIGHGEENEGGTQGRIVCLDGATVEDGQPKVIWQIDGIKVKFTSPILANGMLYVCDDAGKLFCLDAATGKTVWDFRYGSNPKGSPVLADGKIYITEVDSGFHILKDHGKKAPQRIFKATFPPRGFAPTELHGSPAIADGRIYFTTTEGLYCIGKPDHKAKTDPIPAQKAIGRAPVGAKAAWIQVVPADVSLHAGKSADFKAFAYDSRGRLIGEVAGEWSAAPARPPVFPKTIKVAPPKGKKAPPIPLKGKLSATKGKAVTWTAAARPGGQFGRVVVKVGELSGEARVRVAPTTSYTMDLKDVPDGAIPGGWINTQGKFMVATLPGGEKVLRKRNDNTNILLAQALAYITLPTASNYTVEAEMMGTQVTTFLPEMGIGVNRYRLVMVGADSELRLVSWDAQKRINESVNFPLKPKTWYRMKLTTEVKGGKGIIKGKVWERGQKEPAGWTVTATDPIPQTEGAAVLYGWSTGITDGGPPGTEIYYKNVRISTP